MPKPTTAGLLILASGLAFAQPLRFEVASVKPSINPAPPLGVSGGPGTSDPIRITGHGVTVTQLLVNAYSPPSGMDFDQISGPSWINSEKYEILATVPPGATKTQVQEMWRTLLSDRFHIETHWTKKEFPGYELVVAKSGPKLKPSADANASDQSAPPLRPEDIKLDKDGFVIVPPGVRYFQAGGKSSRLTFRNSAMTELAQRLGWPLSTWSGPGIALGRVKDKTGLTGKYDFNLKFSGAMSPGGAFANPTAENGLDEDRDGPGLFDALQKQLGLRLVEKKLSLDVLVVDRAAKVPTAN